MGIASPPYRIETDRLVIRCYDPFADAPLLKECVDSSIDHLLPWMPWARFEPQTLEEKVELLRRFRANFDSDADYPFGVFARDESRQLGGSGLHQRGGESSLEIGYFIRADSIGQGLATELSAVLTRVGFEICGVDRMDIQIDPENARSIRIPEKLGYTLEGRLRRRLPPKTDDGPRRDSLLYTMVREELAGSPCVQFDYVA
ncbi:MAG TPA: GNAT family protein [Gaiellaceae bacterium]|nr:GNAT family protein [Gaiellaceae bacterium]